MSTKEATTAVNSDGTVAGTAASTAAAVTDPAAAAAASAAASAANTPWYKAEAKDYVSNKGWKSPDEVIGSYQSLESLYGADKAGRTVILPKDDKDLEGIKTFRAKLGVPESADKYELPVPQGQGGGDMVKEASAWFHEAGIPKSAAQKITERWNAHIEKLVKDNELAAQVESRAQLEKLQQEWGQEFEVKSEYARRFLKAAGWDDAKMALYESTFGTATMLKDFFQWGSKVGEPGFASGQQQSFAPNKSQIQAKIKELRDQRIANQITDKEFHAQMSILGPQSEAAA